MDSTSRKSEWKPSNSLAKKIKLINTLSLSGFVFPGVLYQFVDLADRAVVTDL